MRNFYRFFGERAPLIFFVILFMTSAVTAITLNIDGGYVGEQVSISLDKEAFIILRMDNGTPIFAKGTEITFISGTAGNLSVEAIDGDERVFKTVSIIENKEDGTQRNEGAGGNSGTQDPVYFLPDSTFTKKDSGGNDHTFKYRTAVGALEKASQILGMPYEIKDTSMGPYIRCVNNICEKSQGAESGWMYWVNYGFEDSPSLPASEYELQEGDVLTWFFSESIGGEPNTALYSLKITVKNGFYIKIDDKITGESEAVAENGGEGGTGGISRSIYDSEETVVNANFIFSDSDLNLSSINCNCTFTMSEQVVNFTDVTSIGFSEEIGEDQFIITSTKPDLSSLKIYAGIYKTFKVDLETETGGLVKFRVQKSWLEANNYTKEDISLFKIKKDGYIEIPTRISGGNGGEIRSEDGGEDGLYVYYVAELSSFSTFAIAAKWTDFPLNLEDERISRSVNWLITAQGDDGGFANPGEEPTISKTAWAILAFVSAGIDPNEVRKNGKSPVDYIKNNLNESVGRMGTIDYALTILALKSANSDENLEDINGVNLLNRLKNKVNEDGQIGDYVHTTIWGIIALKTCGVDVNKSVQWLKQHQNVDGGFSWAVGGESDYDDTAAAIQALIASGEEFDSETVRNALEYIKGGQNPDGGFRYFGTSSSNAASDGWVIQALVAANQNPKAWKRNNISVVDHLISLQTEEGYFKYTEHQESNPGYMTVCALMALTGNYHPISFQSRGLAVTSDETIAELDLIAYNRTTNQNLGMNETMSSSSEDMRESIFTDQGKKISGKNGDIFSSLNNSNGVNLPRTGIILVVVSIVSLGLVVIYVWRYR